MERKSVNLAAKLRPDPPDDRDYQFSSIPDSDRIMKSASVLPAKHSWISEMSPVKYQGNLGSCVAFSVCALKEWQEEKEHRAEVAAGKVDHRGNEDYNFSEQWAYWNAKKIDPWPKRQGTNFRSVLKVIQKIGVPTEDAWPYSDDHINIGKPKSWAHLIARWSTIDSYWKVEKTIPSIKRALVEGPILLGMNCYEEMYGSLERGRIPLPAKPNERWSRHAVLAIGFNDEDQTLCFKNSWSKFWGDNGYGYISYDYVKNYCFSTWAVKDISVTPDMLKGTVELIK